MFYSINHLEFHFSSWNLIEWRFLTMIWLKWYLQQLFDHLCSGMSFQRWFLNFFFNAKRIHTSKLCGWTVVCFCKFKCKPRFVWGKKKKIVRTFKVSLVLQLLLVNYKTRISFLSWGYNLAPCWNGWYLMDKEATFANSITWNCSNTQWWSFPQKMWYWR